jgi:hypothetical protein
MRYAPASDPAGQWPGSDADDPTAALQLLGHIADGVGKGPEANPDKVTSRWVDEVYLYFEACVDRLKTVEADISIHNGRVFFRIERDHASDLGPLKASNGTA